MFNEQYYKDIWGTVHRHDYCESLANTLISKYGRVRYLDIGTGCGYLVKLLNDKGAFACGLEISDYAVNNSHGNVVKGSVTNIPFKDNSFDVVLSQGLWEYVLEGEIDKAYSECLRVGKYQVHNIDAIGSGIAEEGFVTKQTHEWWDRKLLPKVLVTGSKGFIGHHLVKYLEDKGYKVKGVDMESDLRVFENALKATEGINWVFNLAALNGSIEFTTNNKAELIHNNALVNLNMAEACWKNGVRRVFFSSSACVYPIHYQDTDEVHALKEEDVDPAHPDTEYGWEKLFAEHIWKSYEQDRGLEVRIARFINVYGTECLIDTLKSKAPMALTKKVIDAGDGGDVEIWGSGEQKRTFCYITDLLDGIYKLMISDVNEPINLGSDNLISINDLVDLIAKLEGIKVNKVHQLNKVQGVRTRMPDISKAKTLLGWQPTTRIDQGLLEVNKYVKSIS